MIDHSTDDAFHAKVLRDCQMGMMTGQVEELPPTTRWRLSFLCNHCSGLHTVTGTYEQVHVTTAIFMMLGYPLVTVEEEAFATLVSLDQLNLATPEGLKEAAKSYQAFCEEIRR